MSTTPLQEHSFIPVDVDRQIDELLAQSDGHSSKHAATVVKGRGLTVTVIALRSGAQMHDHAAAGDAVLVGMRGQAKVHSKPGGSTELKPGSIVALGTGNVHSVRAEEDAAFLLVLRHGA